MLGGGKGCGAGGGGGGGGGGGHVMLDKGNGLSSVSVASLLSPVCSSIFSHRPGDLGCLI